MATILMLLLLLFLPLSRDVIGCIFPDFLESHSSAEDATIHRDWRTHWRQHVYHADDQSSSTSSASAQVFFDGGVMRSEDTTRLRRRQMTSEMNAANQTLRGRHGHEQRHPHQHSRFTFTRECQQIVVVNGNAHPRYLATHRQAGDSESKFICVEFVWRTSTVIQIRESPLVTTLNRSLCEDESMSWNHWLLIDRSRFFTAYQPCPLDGGFNLRMFDGVRRVGICDSYDGETRLEADCTSGDGLIFRFRLQSCIPPELDAAVTQRIYCVAAWSSPDDGQTYAVLRHDTLERAWCLRYPTRHSADEGFIAYLFLDLRCYSGTSMPTATNRYLRLVITRDSRHDQPALCVDDYEACAFWASPCLNTTSAVVKMTCAKSCDECIPDKRPSICSSLPQTFHGSWIDINQPVGLRITINSGTLLIDGYGVLTCVSWNYHLDDVIHESATATTGRPNQSSSPVSTTTTTMLTPTTSVWQQMVVTTFSNGCRPRYSCVQLIKRAPSVLHYRLSQTEIWPPDDVEKMSSSKEFNCDWFHYKDDAQPLGSKYRSKHFKVATIADRGSRQYVDCRLERSLEFSARFTACNISTECSGRLKYGTHSHSLQFIVDSGCLNSEPVLEEFQCLESTFRDISAKDWMIVSERAIIGDSDDPEIIVCWLLAPYGYRQNAVYRLTAEQCHSDARHLIGAAQLRPAVTLVEVRRGSVGWFDPISVTDRPGRDDDVRTASVTTDDVYANDDWSFLDGSSVVNVYSEPYIATDDDDQPDAELIRTNNHQPSFSADMIISLYVAPLIVSVLFAGRL